MCDADKFSFPPADSPLHFTRFFDTLYSVYDLRYTYMASSIATLKRIEWDENSPALRAIGSPETVAGQLGYALRLA